MNTEEEELDNDPDVCDTSDVARVRLHSEVGGRKAEGMPIMTPGAEGDIRGNRGSTIPVRSSVPGNTLLVCGHTLNFTPRPRAGELVYCGRCIGYKNVG